MWPLVAIALAAQERSYDDDDVAWVLGHAGFGLKVGQVTRKTFEARIRELVTGQATLGRIAEVTNLRF